MAQGVHLRKYGAATNVNFQLYDPDGVDMAIAVTIAAGDIKIMKDNGAEANTGSVFVDEGQGYSIALTATEMQAARIVIYVVDQTATKLWLDTAIIIETYGNASAEHAFDLDTANVTLASATHTGAVIPTVTTLTNLPSIPSNWLTAAGITTGALDGKGDWALATVLGALTTAASTGNPGTTITLIAYLKQVINILIGTAGITTFPSEAAPGNAVSLAEVIRAIHADVTGIAGAAMRGTDSAALASVCTEGRLAELDPANIPADVDTLKTGVNVTQISSSTAAADQLQANLDTSDAGIASGTPTTTTMVSDIAITVDDQFNGKTLIFDKATTTAALQNQATDITACTASTNTLTFTALTTAPVSGDIFVII